MAPVILALRKRRAEFTVRVAVTAQHRELLDPVLKLFGIRPDHDLGIMRPRQSLTDVSVRALSRLEPVIRSEKPDLVLVHGDTTTTLMGALAAFYQRVPVGHVEAGLRSGDDANPFPEEANRRLTDGLSVLHFAPTVDARRNLLREGRPAVGQPSIRFLRKGVGIVAGAKARLHVSHGNPLIKRGQGPHQGGGRVAVDQHEVRLFGANHGLQAGQRTDRNVRQRLARAHDSQIVVGTNSKELQNGVQQIPVLGGHGDSHVEFRRTLPKGQNDRGHFDGLGPGAEHKKDFLGGRTFHTRPRKNVNRSAAMDKINVST
jgi:hypothetical protein